MQRISIPEQGLAPNFIDSWLIEPLSLCDEIIDYFEGNWEQQAAGETSEGLNLQVKNSVDLTINPRDLLGTQLTVFRTYFDALFSCYRDYQAEWPELGKLCQELNISRFTVQRYQSGQHYQGVHSERSDLGALHRLFAWMTYLNDVNPADGGSTLFTHYGLKIQPKRGLTLIWPAEWTHAHKGNVLLNGSKYIMTGWLHFAS